MFITFSGHLHVVNDKGDRLLCGHEVPKSAGPQHNDQSLAPICPACLAKASPHIAAFNRLHEAKRYEPILKPYGVVGLKERHHVKPLEGQMELFT